jgi:hypothetical protein
MSMVCGILSISDDTIKLVRQHPLLLLKLTCDEEEFKEAVAHQQSSRGSFLSKLFGKKNKKPIPLPEYIPSTGEGLNCELDKAWHGIHFLLTGSAWEGEQPLNFLLTAGEAIEGSETGYGPDRVFTSEDVKQIDNALQSISKKEFESRFDPQKMMEEDIYPNIWDRPKEEDDTLSYISEYFVEMKQYIHTIAAKNMGIVVELC